MAFVSEEDEGFRVLEKLRTNVAELQMLGRGYEEEEDTLILLNLKCANFQNLMYDVLRCMM